MDHESNRHLHRLEMLLLRPSELGNLVVDKSLVLVNWLKDHHDFDVNAEYHYYDDQVFFKKIKMQVATHGLSDLFDVIDDQEYEFLFNKFHGDIIAYFIKLFL